MTEQEAEINNSLSETSGQFGQAGIRLLLSARICLLSIALFFASLYFSVFEYQSIPRNYIFIPIAVLFAVSGISAFWLKKGGNNPIYIYFHLTIDMLIVTGAVYITGVHSSPLVFLFLPLILAASLLLNRSSLFIFAGTCSAFYTLLSIGVTQQWIPTADGSSLPNVPLSGFILHVVGLVSGMFLVAFFSGYLKRIILVNYADAEQSKKDIEALNNTQRELEEKLAMQDRMARLLADKSTAIINDNSPFAGIIGESPIMQKVFTLIRKVASSDATVLISGESGTGKELVARAIHAGKANGKAPFVAVNCGAIPENLIESQLFGHKKGSFTGADNDYPGLFLQADGGTIFLDEIGELPVLMQTKLLRVIQEKSMRPVGGTKDMPVDVRIIAATNRNLKKEVEAGNFREDLYYRLNVISIRMPPLRSRKEDIPLLVRTILRKLLPLGTEAVMAPGSMEILMSYNYPGNVRELENILERAIILGGEVILPEHLPSLTGNGTGSALKPMHETAIIIDDNITFPVQLEEILAEIERKYLEAALIQTNGMKKSAAEILGINFRSLRYRLQKFGIEKE